MYLHVVTFFPKNILIKYVLIYFIIHIYEAERYIDNIVEIWAEFTSVSSIIYIYIEIEGITYRVAISSSVVYWILLIYYRVYGITVKFYRIFYTDFNNWIGLDRKWLKLLVRCWSEHEVYRLSGKYVSLQWEISENLYFIVDN